MGEDMTYATEPTRAQLAARVAELERENAELRERLDAVPMDALRTFVFGDSDGGDWIPAVNMVANWIAIANWTLATPVPTDDDTDAPLKLATAKDGDE